MARATGSPVAIAKSIGLYVVNGAYAQANTGAGFLGGSHLEHGYDDVDAAHGLLQLFPVAFPPPEFGEVVGDDNNVPRSELIAETTMSRKDALIAIAQFVEKFRPHTVPVHLIDKEGVLSCVVVAPEAGVLVGELVVVGSEIVNETGGEPGFAGSGGANDEDDHRFEVARLRLESLVVGERFVVTDPLAEVVVGDFERTRPFLDALLDGEEVGALSLVFWASMSPGSIETGLLLFAVKNGLFLRATARFPMGAFQTLKGLEVGEADLLR